MRSISITKPGGPEVLEIADIEVPRLRSGEVLIEVRAAGVNRPDLAQRAGRYPVPADASKVPGLEVAGTVVDIAQDVENVRVGAEVMALVHGGGYAEYCAVDHRHLMPVPHGFSMVEAAALPEVAMTVEYNVLMRAGLTAGEHLLIHGGSSGIGTHAISRALSVGAIPITTSRGRRKMEFCRDVGAIAIDSSVEDWPSAVMSATAQHGVDVVLDMVAGDFVQKNIACLADDGRYALISLQGGRTASVNMEAILRRRLSILGSTLRPLSAERKAGIVQRVRRDVLPKIEAGFMRPRISQTFDLRDAAQAHQLLEDGDHLGKVVLVVN